MKIKETLVVEGKDDKAAVLAAVDANVICTHGYGMNDDIIRSIRKAYETCGIVIFTDPDHAGMSIRKKLSALFPDAKHAYLTDKQAFKNGDIGIENASPQDIINALKAADAAGAAHEPSEELTRDDMCALGLDGLDQSRRLRMIVGGRTGIGYANAKTFLRRLNYYNIKKDELTSIVQSIYEAELI